MTSADEERADLNALIREAHGAIKDLNKVIKDFDNRFDRAQKIIGDFDVTLTEFEKKIRDVASLVVGDLVDERVSPAVDEFLVGLTGQIELIQAAIYHRFEAMTEELTDGKGKVAWQDLPLPDYLLNVNFPRRDQTSESS